MLLSATSRKGQLDADLQTVQNREQALVNNKQEWPARCWLTCCSKPRAGFYQQPGNGQPDANLQTVQNQEHTLVSNNQEWLARCWLTSCSNPEQALVRKGMASQMLTYILFRTQTQSMLLLTTSREGLPDIDWHPAQDQEYALVSNKQGKLARCWLTTCLKPRVCPYQQQAGKAIQMLTYSLFKTQIMRLLATSWKDQPDDLQPVQNPEHASVSNKLEGPARSWLTNCPKEHPLVSDKQNGLYADLQTVQNPEHPLVRNKQKEPARCQLTNCQNPEHPLVNNRQKGPVRCLLTYCSKTHSRVLSAMSRKGQPDADLHAVKYPELLSTTSRNGQPASDLHSVQNPEHSMLLSTTTRKSQPDVDLHSVQSPEHALVSNKQRVPARCSLTYYLTTRAGSCQW